MAFHGINNAKGNKTNYKTAVKYEKLRSISIHCSAEGKILNDPGYCNNVMFVDTGAGGPWWTQNQAHR